MNAVENNNIALQVRYEQEQELRDTILLFDGDEKKLTLIIDAKNKAQIVGAVDGVVGSIEGLVSLVTDIPGNVVALADAVINYKQTYDAIKISVTEWTELYDYALKNNPALAGEMAGYLEGKIGGGIVTGYAVSGAAAKVIVKVARLKKASKLVNKGTNRSRKKTDIKKEFDRNHGKSFETLKEEFNTGKGSNAGKGTEEIISKIKPKTLSELNADLTSKGFRLKGTSAGGYTTYIHPDGRIVTIKPTGEVIPTKPKIVENGKKYNEN